MNTFDKNGNGEIDFTEFIAALTLFTGSASPQEWQKKVEFLFALYDLDGDKFISCRDLFHMLKSMVGSNLNEVQIQQLVDRTIRKFDHDRDGKLSLAEFHEAVKDTRVDRKMQINMAFYSSEAELSRSQSFSSSQVMQAQAQAKAQTQSHSQSQSQSQSDISTSQDHQSQPTSHQPKVVKHQNQAPQSFQQINQPQSQPQHQAHPSHPSQPTHSSHYQGNHPQQPQNQTHQHHQQQAHHHSQHPQHPQNQQQ